ncbi:MAG: hypothetical protein KDA93_04050 [Planctomycetaceae bacterium]|nr:hypothetical protein [Planctomycetaceae bacterium]
MTDRACPLNLLQFALLIAIISIPGRHSRAGEDLSRYYAGLRQRGLFRVAESDCLRRLSDPEVTLAARAELTIELSKAYTEHALSRGGDERDALWSRAGDVVDEMLQANVSPSFRVMLEAQRAFVMASRGTQLRWQVELQPLDRKTTEDAILTLQRTIGILEPIPNELDEQTRNVSDRLEKDMSQAESLPSLRQLREMRRRAEFRLAVAGVDLGTVFPRGPDQDSALSDAELRLKDIANTPRPDGQSWQAEVLLIQILRLRGDTDRVESRVAALSGKEPPASIRDAAVAELVRIQLMRAQPDAAIEILQAHREKHGFESDELRCLVVETLLAARSLAFEKQQTEAADDFLKRAEAFAADIPGAWGARSRLLLDMAHDADVYGPQLAGVVRQAKWAWKNGELEQATKLYRQATVEAHRAGRVEFAVEFGLTLATLQTQTGDTKGAIDTIDGLLKSYPDSEQAADTDLLRAYARGKEFEAKPDDTHRQSYRAALEQHVEQFSDSPTSAEATWMLARLDEYERNFPAAINELKSIPLSSKRAPAAAQRVAVLYEQMLVDARQRGDTTDEIKQQAIDDLTSLVDRFQDMSQPLASEQADVSASLAKLLLQQSPPDFDRADALLEQVLQVNDASDDSNGASIKPTTLAAASRLRIISLAGQGRLDDAAALLDGLAEESPERMLEVLNGLTSAAEQVAIQHRQTVSQLQLDISQRLEQRRDSLPAEAQLQLDESLAQSYAAIGQVPKAASLYEKLIWQQPRNLSLVKSLATLYESCGSDSCLRNAIEQWKKLEQLQKKGTIDWLETRYHLAWCSHKLGDDETARKLIGVTRVLYPELGTQQLKLRFEKLSTELKTR